MLLRRSVGLSVSFEFSAIIPCATSKRKRFLFGWGECLICDKISAFVGDGR
ncbi:hypothetical protein VVMO6_03102 [Vibrio vulnificus MO6-24/O]|nr:hypothetical protein VVMO6_03102 [Vibrio vulnificus MO6-24/O]